MSERLEDIAARMVAAGKGILAADESSGTIKKRFDSIGVESTADTRRDYREMLFRSDAMKDYVSGVILYDETIRQNAKDGTPLVKLIADAGAGTGYLLARVLDGTIPQVAGLALDISKHAIKRAARAHPRIGAVVADVWRPIPVRDRRAVLVMNAFAPRNGAEFARILAPGGTLLVVTPAPGHLGDLIGALGLLTVDQDKDRRLAAALADHFTQVGEVAVETTMTLGHDAVEAVVAMGPSAWHTDPDTLRRRIANLPEECSVPGLFRITLWKPIR